MEEHRLRLLENRMLRRIFRPKRGEVTEDWKKLLNGELNKLYSQNVFRVIKKKKMRLTEHVACMGERIGIYRDLVWKSEEKRPLGSPRHRWEENIKMDLQEMGLRVMDWIELAQNRDMWQVLVNAVMNLRVP
jgi:hypothetical protein